MKLFKTLLLVTVLTVFSCSKDENDTSQLPEQGNISLALSNGAGFVVENIEARISNLYNTANTSTITITGTTTVSNNGTLRITIVDNDNSFNAIANGNDISVGDTSNSFYATIEYQDDSFGSFIAGAGTVKITNYSEVSGENYALLSATFSAADSNFKNMTSSILGLVLNCTGC